MTFWNAELTDRQTGWQIDRQTDRLSLVVLCTSSGINNCSSKLDMVCSAKMPIDWSLWIIFPFFSPLYSIMGKIKLNISDTEVQIKSTFLICCEFHWKWQSLVGSSCDFPAVWIPGTPAQLTGDPARGHCKGILLVYISYQKQPGEWIWNLSCTLRTSLDNVSMFSHCENQKKKLERKPRWSFNREGILTCIFTSNPPWHPCVTWWQWLI